MHLRVSFLVGSLALGACEAPPGSDSSLGPPVLEFPEVGVDDPAAYDGYATRFFRDSHGNALQVYLNNREGRVVHVWADAANESAGFNVQDADGSPVTVAWGGPGATTGSEGTTRFLRHRLSAATSEVEIGWFLLGTMRQERDFQYFQWHRRPYGDEPFVPGALTDLIASVERLPAVMRESHLTRLDATSVDELRDRLEPAVSLTEDDGGWAVTVEHTSLDGRNHISLELRGDDATAARVGDDRIFVSATGGGVAFDVTISTDSEPLTPLGRDRLFNDAFEAYFASVQRVADSLGRAAQAGGGAVDPRVNAFRRIERQVLGLELLSYEEKLMASMPNYATYFGRDQMMSALMLEPISSVDLQEGVISSVVGKIEDSGNVSHEEALGGQAIRQNAAEYSRRIEAWEETRDRDPDAAAGHLAEAVSLLEDLQAVRENYHMVDDDFQLAVLVDRYLSRTDVSDERKRAFLGEAMGYGPSRLESLGRNLAFMAELARPYAESPVATNLVAFFRRDERGWLPGSWRDSRPGYGGGKFAMDVNAVWVPEALASLERILDAVEALGLPAEEITQDVEDDASALVMFMTDRAALRAAIEAWRGARRHFEVRWEPAMIRSTLDGWLAASPPEERDYWRQRVDEEDAAARPIAFLAVALDEAGRPLGVLNTDPATELFLIDPTEDMERGTADVEAELEVLDTFERAYPVGVFVPGLGPLVATETFGDEAVRAGFRESLYHSPRVVWGREVNLLLLGLALRIDRAHDESGRPRDLGPRTAEYLETLYRVLEKNREAVEASGLSHNELWSYRIEDGALRPVRYGVSSDIQLWNVTDLSVGFLLDRLPPR